jgi:hypothetical protein
MKRILLAALLVSLAPVARAGVDVNINVGLPAVPPLVVVQPGIQVVEHHHEEVFFARGWYWARRPPHWYRARHAHATFVLVEPRYVPATLRRMPPGHYKHWSKAEEKRQRREAKAERKRWKEHARAGRHDDRHGHRGHGHD